MRIEEGYTKGKPMSSVYEVEAYNKNGEYLEQFSRMISGMGSFQAENHCRIEGVDAFRLSCKDVIPSDTYKIALYANNRFEMYLSVTPEKFNEHVERLKYG